MSSRFCVRRHYVLFLQPWEKSWRLTFCVWDVNQNPKQRSYINSYLIQIFDINICGLSGEVLATSTYNYNSEIITVTKNWRISQSNWTFIKWRKPRRNFNILATIWYFNRQNWFSIDWVLAYIYKVEQQPNSIAPYSK